MSQQSWAGSGEPPLWAPWYGAPFAAAVKRFFKKYATFSGRASRSEYWWWTLVSIIVSIVLNIVITAGINYTGYGPTAGLGTLIGILLAATWLLAFFIPSLALSVRRLHDSNKSGWMLLLALVPVAGPIIVLVFMLLGPEPAGQQYDQPMA
nr:DUF805 domain-containing protein [Arthrobacter sp. AFG7.2]